MTNFDQWLEIVSKVTHIKKSDILSRDIRWEIATARQMYILLLSRQGFSVRRISLIVRRTLVAVYHAIDRAEWLYRNSLTFKQTYDEIEERVRAAQPSLIGTEDYE